MFTTIARYEVIINVNTIVFSLKEEFTTNNCLNYWRTDKIKNSSLEVIQLKHHLMMLYDMVEEQRTFSQSRFRKGNEVIRN